MPNDGAEILALEALAWLAGEEGLLARFLAGSGMEITDLRARAADPEVMAAVTDFLLSDDALISGFCEASGYSLRELHAARRLLPGLENER